MKLLLDTHTALWLLNEYEQLSSVAKSLLLNDENTLHISVASAWEVAIKTSTGKLTEFDGGVGSFMAELEEMPIILLPIKPKYLEIVETLPFIHRDPFDRLLIATAKTENMIILTADENIHKYDVLTTW